MFPALARSPYVTRVNLKPYLFVLCVGAHPSDFSGRVSLWQDDKKIYCVWHYTVLEYFKNKYAKRESDCVA